MGKTILVVDDDLNFRRSVVRIIRNSQLKIVEASNGKEALGILSLEKVDLVISDIRMPVMHGIELFHAMKKSISIPFIFMTGFSDILEISEAHELGAKGFLSKPFEREELLRLVNEVFKDENLKLEIKESESTDYFGIPVDEFISGKQVNFPIYLQLTEEKYIKVANYGDDLSPERVNIFKNKGINYLYLTGSDFRKHINFRVSMTDSVISSDKITREKKTEILTGTNKIIYDYGFKNGIDNETYAFACKVVTDTINLLPDDSALLNFLSLINTNQNDIFYHSIGVATVSNLIAHKKGWESFAIHYQITLAALFHDIGFKDIPKEIIKIPKELMDDQQRKLYENHCIVGAEIMRKVGNIEKSIDEIILQHHERCDGSGYPQGINKNKIHPIALLIGVADEFCMRFHGPIFSEEGNKNLKQAAQEVVNQKTLFPKDNLVALSRLFLGDEKND